MQGNNQGPAQLVASVGSGVGVAATQFSNKAKEEAKIAKTIGNAVSADRPSPTIRALHRHLDLRAPHVLYYMCSFVAEVC